MRIGKMIVVGSFRLFAAETIDAFQGHDRHKRLSLPGSNLARATLQQDESFPPRTMLHLANDGHGDAAQPVRVVEAAMADAEFDRPQWDLETVLSEPFVQVSEPEPNSFYPTTTYKLTQAAGVGAFTGVLVAVFKLSIEAVREVSYGQNILVSYPFLIAAIPAFGGLVVGLLMLLGGPYPPGLRGIIQEVDQNQPEGLMGMLRQQGNFVRKSVASVATLGTGCSLGPEGPSVEIGLNVAKACAAFNRPESQVEWDLSTEAKDQTQQQSQVTLRRAWNREILLCGAAAGVAAGFNAPLAGVFFAIEIMQNTFASVDEDSATKSVVMPTPSPSPVASTKAITPILLASVLSAMTSKLLLGDELVLKVEEFDLATPLLELPLYLALGALSGFVAFVFTYTAKVCKQFFDGEYGPDKIKRAMASVPNAAKPVIGGLLCGLVGIAFPQVLFFGYETLNSLLKDSNNLAPETIGSLLGVKLTMTAIAAGSGLVGGTFAPSLFLGAMLGALFHDGASGLVTAVQQAAASMNIIELAETGVPVLEIASVPAYAMVGAASVLAALFRAPLTATLLLFELSRNYDVILPLMSSAGVGSIVGDILEDRFEKREQMQRRDRDPVSWGDLSFETLELVHSVRLGTLMHNSTEVSLHFSPQQIQQSKDT